MLNYDPTIVGHLFTRLSGEQSRVKLEEISRMLVSPVRQPGNSTDKLERVLERVYNALSL